MNITSRLITITDNTATVSVSIDMKDGSMGDIAAVVEDMDSKLEWHTNWNIKQREAAAEKAQS